MIERYMNDLDVLISASPSIVDIDIIRRDIRDTGLEKTALFRYRIKLIDESLIEITERILEERGDLQLQSTGITGRLDLENLSKDGITHLTTPK